MTWLPAPFDLLFMQRAALEIGLLAPLAALIGSQVVLRGFAFFSHGVGTASFPGLVLAGPLGLPSALCALAAGSAFAILLRPLERVRGVGREAATGLILVAALAIGIVLASDVYESGPGVDRLLFGSLLAIGAEELFATGCALAVGLGAWSSSRRSWIAAGFDPQGARALGVRTRATDLALLVAMVVAVVAAIDAVGALLVSAIIVIPAATARLFARSVRTLELGAGALALSEGFAGLVLAFELDVPPGAAISVLGGAVYACVAIAATLTRRSRPAEALA